LHSDCATSALHLAKHVFLSGCEVNTQKLRAVPVLLTVMLVLGVLSACGEEESNRTFAPETDGSSQLSTNTPMPTSTIPPLDRQPGESPGELADAKELFQQSGSAEAITSGAEAISIVTVQTGRARNLPIRRSPSILAVAAPDGSTCLILDRSAAVPSVQLYRADGTLVAKWSPKPVSATPQASPTAQSREIETGDEVAWKQDSSGVTIAISGVGVFVADKELKMQEVRAGRFSTVTSLAWSPTGQSIAMGTWNPQQRSAAILTVGLQQLDSAGTLVFSLPDGDGRYIRSLAWGSEKVGLVFALRAISSNFALPNDLYFLPRFGEPMRLLASAGIAAPAAVVDQVAIAGNGSTVAFSILIPGSAGLRFHSIWLTDALAPASTKANTTGLRRINEIRWTKDGVSISGTRRAQANGAAFQVAVVEQLSTTGPVEIAAERSDPTPLASPVASPLAASPETD
jgi:hypothetical protein